MYDLAREGITIKRELREVTILNLTNEMISNDEISISTDVSKTYIRSLAVDIFRVCTIGG